MGGNLNPLDQLHRAVGSLTKKIFGIEEPKATPPPDPQKAEKKAEDTAAKENEERRRRVSQQGFASTVKTSLMGLSSDAPTKKKTLLGGG